MRALLVLLISTLVACASSPGIRMRPIEGTIADRLLALQESVFALIIESDSSIEAAERITQYCADHSAAIEQLAAESAALGEGPEAQALAVEVAERGEKLVDRASEALEDRVHLLTDGRVVIAMAQCRALPTPTEPTPPPEPTPSEPDPEDQP